MEVDTMNALNWLDLFLLGICVLLTLLGAWAGLIRSLFHIAAWIAAIAGAWFAGQSLPQWLSANIGGIPPTGLKILSWLVGFLLIFILIRLMGNHLHRWISRSPLNSVNRLGGALIGFLKGILLSIIILLVLSALPVQGDLQRTRDQSLIWQFFDTYLVEQINPFAGKSL